MGYTRGRDVVSAVPGERYREIAERLEKWCVASCREYPWRKTSDPYVILVTEFLLQRTRADVVEKLFGYLFSKYRNARELASARREDLYGFFSKLGLLYRAQRILEVAKEIVKEYGGVVPCNMERLLLLRGVGVYIASAVLNFGCDQPTPVVDKNVMRVLNRLFNITSEWEGRRVISELYRYGDHKLIAYALIDIGALICKEIPRCAVCPLNNVCPKYPLRKHEWRMLRKVLRRGRVILQEQPTK